MKKCLKVFSIFFIFIGLLAPFFSSLNIVLADTTSTLRPTADGGNDSADWKNTTGTQCSDADCYLEIDESSGSSCTNSDGDTSYVQNDVNGASQTFDIDTSSITDDSTITQIDITVCYKSGAPGGDTNEFQTRRCFDGSCANSGTSIATESGYTETTQSHTGLSITKTDSTDLEIGTALTGTAEELVRITQISAVITYTPPAPPADTTAPAVVTDLALYGATDSSITFSWTAPGDDGNTGAATSYDVRYSTATITDANWSSATQATGEPTPSAAGASESMTVSSLTAGTTYYFALKTSDDAGNESGLSNVPNLATTGTAPEPEPILPPPVGAGVRVAFFSGQAYPAAKIEVLRKRIETGGFVKEPIEELMLANDGRFAISLTALIGEEFLFALRVEDKDGRKTGIVSFNVNLRAENELVAENIFVPPTIGFDNTVVTKGQEITILGYAAPNNKIQVEIDGEIKGEAQSANSGYWSFTLNTSDLNLGEHYVKAKQIRPSGTTSDFSFPRAFKVSLLTNPKADFNNDNQVNITDWSIFLFRWGSEDQTLKSKIDMDDNRTINITDFSIFLKSMRI